ncbi:MAG: hypothetical protein KatS3mg129_0890 [Leptospiraceae bacterium]|nr:MAG: hypothetical protein KatS3mg129_0890 [Leptospiraceae bacterium]
MLKKAFFIPFILFLSTFTFDKLFLLDSFPIYYLTTGSFINFEHKEKLIFELKEYLKQSKEKRKNVLVIMGNSRSMSFDNHYIEKNFPEWTMFNFSVPGGTQDYFLYLMEKFKKYNIKPEAILFAVTPQGMNLKPAVLTDEVMVFGLPPEFIIRKFYYYKVDEITNYIGKKLFVVYKYRPKIRVIKSRLNDSNLLSFINFLIKTEMVLEQNRGNVPSHIEYKPSVSEEVLEKNAKSIWKDFFTPFVLNKNSLYFVEECIKISKELNISKIGLFWPPVSPQLKKRKRNDKVAIVYQDHKKIKKTVYEVWTPEMINISKKYNILWLDFNYEMPLKCNYFSDASHLASICYDEYTDKIFTSIGVKK